MKHRLGDVRMCRGERIIFQNVTTDQSLRKTTNSFQQSSTSILLFAEECIPPARRRHTRIRRGFPLVEEKDKRIWAKRSTAVSPGPREMVVRRERRTSDDRLEGAGEFPGPNRAVAAVRRDTARRKNREFRSSLLGFRSANAIQIISRRENKRLERDYIPFQLNQHHHHRRKRKRQFLHRLHPSFSRIRSITSCKQCAVLPLVEEQILSAG